MPSASLVRETIEKYLEGWRTGDRSAWLSLFSDDAVLIDPVGAPSNQGRDAIATFWDRIHQLPMVFEPRVERIVVCGSEAMALFRMVSRPAEGTGGMSVAIVDTFEVDDDGCITSLKAYWDNGCIEPLTES